MSGDANHSETTWSRFEGTELAIVLSNYDIGVIDSVTPFRKGSRRSPKLLVATDRGPFLVKRLAPAKADMDRVRFTHAIQSRLLHSKFPLPRLIPTKATGETMVQHGDAVYEVYEFIRGTPYDQGLQTTYQSGQALALYHRVLADFQPTWEPSAQTYHNAAQVPAHLAVIPERTGCPALQPVVDTLRAAYMRAAETVQSTGIEQWPRQIIHSDWHPGNMLYRGSTVVAVIDYDTARRGQRVLDVANGALQFSVTREGDDPARWPDGLDEGRLKRFCRGYDSVKDCVISTAELAALPSLMIEAMIVESSIPIATTGRFASIEGEAFLRMVERKVRWLAERGRQIA